MTKNKHAHPGIVVVGLVALLGLTACRTPHYQPVPPPSVSPRIPAGAQRSVPHPPVAALPALSVSRSQSVVVNPPPVTRLVWDYPPDELQTVKQFRVYSRPNAISGPWSLFATTTNLSLPFAPTNRSGFFYVTALGVNGLESEPNTK